MRPFGVDVSPDGTAQVTASQCRPLAVEHGECILFQVRRVRSLSMAQHSAGVTGPYRQKTRILAANDPYLRLEQKVFGLGPTTSRKLSCVEKENGGAPCAICDLGRTNVEDDAVARLELLGVSWKE